MFDYKISNKEKKMLTIVTLRPGESVYNQRETTLIYRHFVYTQTNETM